MKIRLALLLLLTACTPADVTPPETGCTESCNARHSSCTDGAGVNTQSLVTTPAQTGMEGLCGQELQQCLKSCPTP